MNRNGLELELVVTENGLELELVGTRISSTGNGAGTETVNLVVLTPRIILTVSTINENVQGSFK